ncbi:MAG: DUF3368 domain-containing protein [Nitrospirae bacterium]|nr:DUF3368 domain-containing protein [Nitrospirota bacterium]
MVVISDAGPLIALGKLDLLHPTFQFYPAITISESVYKEVVRKGLELKAPDASAIEKFCRNRKIKVRRLPARGPLWQPSIGLHKGELDTIRLSLLLSATTVLIDDQDARTEATKVFHQHGLQTRVKGALGLLVELYQKNIIEKPVLKQSLESIIRRRDIWISPKLCGYLIEALEKGELK